MQELIKSWETFFFTELLLSVVLCIALVIALKNGKRHGILKYIPAYIITFLLIIVSSTARTLSYKEYYYNLFNALNEYTDYFFTLIEMFVFSHIYYQLTNNYTFKKIILILNAAFVPFFLFMLFQDKQLYLEISEDTQRKVYTVEGILLLPVCLSYFIGLFRRPPDLNLKNEPGFWLSVGLLFFLTCTLPYSILENYVSKRSFYLILKLYSIFYIFYILLFLMIIRAYLCKPEKSN